MNVIEKLANSLLYENGIVVVEAALALAASLCRQTIVGRDMPLGNLRCDVRIVPDVM